jgi:hypothetical protein
MNRTFASVFLALFSVVHSYGLSASDDAAAYGSTWSDGSNFGSGFNAWDLSSNNHDGSTNYAGAFIGDSTAGAGNINTGTNQSFGLYANPGTAYIDATRSFASSFSANDRFTLKLGVNFTDGNKGFVLRSGTDEVVGFNVGATTEIITDFTDTATVANYDYGGNDAVIDVVIQVINAGSLSYQISRTSSQGIQGMLFSGTVSNITSAINNLKFYNSGTTGGDQNNLYFNSLNVTNVPEPAYSVLALASAALLLVWIVRRR